MGDLAALKAAYSERHLDDAWAVYLDLRASGNPEADLFGALTARAMGDLFMSRTILEEAMERQPSGRDLGQLRLALGEVLRSIGDTMAAVVMLEAFVHGMDQYPELAVGFSAYGWYNLGLALRQAKRLDESIAAYEQAIVECRRDGLNDLLLKSLQNMAWACCLSGDVRRAESALDDADALCESEEARWHQRVGQGFLEAIAGDQQRAMEICEVIARGPSNVPPDVRSHAYWLAGRVARELGQLLEAEALAYQAINSALEARGENRCLQDASELLRDIHTERTRSAGP